MASKISTIVNDTVCTMKITQDPEGQTNTIDRQTAKTYNVPISAGYSGYIPVRFGQDSNHDMERRSKRVLEVEAENGNALRRRSSGERYTDMDLRSYARLHRSFPHSEQDIRRRLRLECLTVLSKVFNITSMDARLGLLWISFHQTHRYRRRLRRPRKKSGRLVMGDV
ncbi:MAG: hypothetical protein ALECFALPRED_011161 [Alectoria fallacina]|uniref:Uncharacterized protein n=1 Tax=Alectoria fallacina TaxID=1903189 RepID=A0A8H3J9J6_9LECA|nr:MAG: hypothetical protein ALECFALPRED_011161 [Alectoria fallacina]